MRLLSSAIAAFTALLAASCLTTPASETGYSARARQLQPKSCGPDALIEDADDADSRILMRAGRGGYWYTFLDPEGSTIEPQSPFKMGAPGRAGSPHAAHMHGVTASSGPSIYAGMAFALTDPRSAYDASRFVGVTFWAKGPAHVRFEIPDAYTAPEGGHCQDCYNDFGIELAFTSEWQRYTLPFAWLSQRQGWGDPRPEIASNALYALEWQFGTPGRSFDVWIDDVEFVCGVDSK